METNMIPELVIAQYEEVIKEIEAKPNINKSTYICISLYNLEAIEALSYLRNNHPRPDKHTGFYNHPDFKQGGAVHVSWWYPQTEASKHAKYPYNNSNKQRVQFLKHLIKQLKKEL